MPSRRPAVPTRTCSSTAAPAITFADAGLWMRCWARREQQERHMSTPSRLGLGLVLLFLSPALAVADVSLERIISREHPAFDARTARLTVGRDGRVYLASGGNATCYVLRLDRDG